MQPYQSYLPQMNNQQMTNLYMDRMNFLQGYQQNLQQPMTMPQANQPMAVSGKIVDSVEVVKATDVPMDGNMYYFPKADGTEIFGKRWLANGQTQILTFKPIFEDETIKSPNETQNCENDTILNLLGTFTQRFDTLENRIDELLTQSQTKTLTKTTKSSTKKESE